MINKILKQRANKMESTLTLDKVLETANPNYMPPFKRPHVKGGLRLVKKKKKNKK